MQEKCNIHAYSVGVICGLFLKEHEWPDSMSYLEGFGKR
jgi:hypothetical protein